MNVLLLALSTVSNGKLNCFSYQYEDEPSFNGYYQGLTDTLVTC